jgi:hypothetical protein
MVRRPFPTTTREHWNNVGSLRCMVSGAPNPTLHHVHGGSILARGIMHGKSKKPSDALVIPLAAMYHTGDEGVDVIGVTTWEFKYGTQAGMVDRVSEQVGYDLWELARLWSPSTPG